MLRIYGTLEPVLVTHPHFPDPVRYSVTTLSDLPDVQVEQTIALMKRYSLEDATAPAIHAAVQHAIARHWTRVQSPTADDLASAIYWWVKDRMRFVHDDVTAAALPAGLAGEVVETLIRPVDMLQSAGAGDCDDYSMLLASMLTAAGVPCEFVTVAADPTARDRYSHVYVVARTPRRIALDASHGTGPGWETPNRFGKRRSWPLIDERFF